MNMEERRAIGEYLVRALERPAAEFDALLDDLPAGAYPGSWTCELRSSVTGTVLLVAAAQNRTEHVELLLRRGWDVDDADDAAAEARLCFGYRAQSLTVAEGFGADHYGALSLSFDRDRLGFRDESRSAAHYPFHRYLLSATPLAAAILCGAEDAVRLLRRRGAKLTESSAVCAVSVLMLTIGGEAQRRCVRLAFGLGEDEAPEAILTRFPLPLCTFADICTAEQLRLRLSGAPCEAEDLRRTVQLLMAGTDRCGEKEEAPVALSPEAKMAAICEAYPDAFRPYPARCDLLLLAMRGKYVPDPPYMLERWLHPEPTLLAAWRRVSGPVRDITCALGFLISMSEEELLPVLDALAADGGELVLAAEGVRLADMHNPEVDPERIENLRVLLSRVRLVRRTRQGMSALAATLLWALFAGVPAEAWQLKALRGEPRAEIVAHVMAHDSRIAVRALAFAVPNEPGDAPEPPEEDDAPLTYAGGCFWTARWQQMTEGDAHLWLAQTWRDPSLSLRECRARLRTALFDKGFPGGGDAFWERLYPIHRPIVSPLHFSVPGAAPGGEDYDGPDFSEMADIWGLWYAALIGRNTNMLRSALELEPDLLRCRLELPYTRRGDKGLLYVTPLALAAAARAAGQVRLLLERGCDPQERDAPLRSCFVSGNCPSAYTSPARLAIFFDHSGDSAEVLRLLRAYPRA